MNQPVECIRCHANMELGYVPDGTHNGYRQQNWFPGDPKPSFWMGLKLDQNQTLPVTTFRCPKCGYLESYARPRTASNR